MDLATILILFSSSSQWRRSKAIKNILIGRRTVSNLYWALQYGLLEDFGSLHGALPDNIDQAVTKLKQTELVKADSELQILLTEKGSDYQSKLLASLPELTLFAWSARYDVFRFSKRLNLAIQIVSEYSYSNNHYYPQTIGLLDSQLIKKWFIQNKADHLPVYLYSMLNHFLEKLSRDEFAEIFTQNLSGHHLSGQTDAQIGQTQGKSPTVISLTKLLLYTQLLTELLSKPNSKLQPLTQGLARPVISNSAAETFTMFCHYPGLTIAKIAQKRHIKLTTAYEHLLEAAIVLPQSDIPFQRLLNPKLEQKLSAIQPNDLGEWPFRVASEQVDKLDFFNFRLFQIKQLKQTD